MPTLSILKTYQDGQALNETDLDNILDSIETFLNDTKIAADNIQASTLLQANLADQSIITSKLEDEAVTANKIVDLNITKAKQEEITVFREPQLGTVSISASSEQQDVTDCEFTIVTTGRPIQLAFQCRVTISGLGGVGTPQAVIRIFRDSTDVDPNNSQIFTGNSNASRPCSFLVNQIFIDSPVAGTYTYSVKVDTLSTNMDLTLSNGLLMGYEIN